MKKLIAMLLLTYCFMLSKAQQYQINATLTGFENKTKFYLKDINTDKKIDSAVLIDGKLSMKGKISQVKALWLCGYYKNQFYFTNLLIGADQVTIKADAKDFPWYVSITGSKSQDKANILNNQVKQLWQERDSLIKIVFPLTLAKQSDSIRKITKPLIKQIQKLDSAREAITENFISANLNSDAALQQLYYKKNSYKKEDFIELMNKINPIYKNTFYGKLLVNYQKVGDILKKGDQFYDFSAADLQGKKYTLSDFKGKYILLDFTETYCAPCIEAAGDLAILAKKYPEELQIISFYGETDPNVMQIGLDRDRPLWPAIWDGKGQQSEISLKYGVTGFPTFVLIAPDGEIISHTSGFGRDDNGKGSLATNIDFIMKSKTSKN